MVRRSSPNRFMHRERGIALVLVMGAVATVMVLALGFLGGATTTTPIAENIRKVGKARFLAETGMEMAVEYIRATSDWRTQMSNGLWATHTTADGNFTITGVDGDESGGDGDLADDTSDTVLITVTATVDGVTHTVRAVVTAGAEETATRLLFVVPDASSLSSQDTLRKDKFEGWGYEVTAITASDSQSAYDAAVASSDVVYVTEDVYSSYVNTKLKSVGIGVVHEEQALLNDFGFSSSGSNFTSDSINITDNSHYITQNLSLGTVVVMSSNQPLLQASGSMASGATVLATRVGDTNTENLMVMETGASLYGGGTAASRRVALPFGGGSMDFAALNATCLDIVKRSIEWAAEPGRAWVGLDIGYTSPAGSDSVSSGEYTVIAQGTNINDYSDEFRFVYKTIVDDGEIVARVTAVPSTSAYAKAGVMVRESLADDSRHGFMGLTRDIGSIWLRRSATSGSSSYTSGAASNAPYWVRVVREGDVIRGYESATGVSGTWVQVGSDLTLSGLSSVVYVGLAVTSQNSGTLGTATLDYVSVTNDTGGNSAPELVALYEFNEVVEPEPTLLHHWALDGADKGGGMAARDNVRIEGFGVVDSYDSSAGVYGGGNVGQAAYVATNSTSDDEIHLLDDAVIKGDAYVGVGGDDEDGFDLEDDGEVTGTKGVLDEAISIASSVSAPGGMPANQGDVTISSNTTWSSDQTFADLTISGSAVVTISGHIRVLVDDDFKMQDSAQIVTPVGSSLTLYLDKDSEVTDSAQLNGDSQATGRVVIYQIADREFLINGNGVVAADVWTRDDFKVSSSGVFYGRILCYDDIEVTNSGQIHLDVNLTAVATPPAKDSVGTLNGQYEGALWAQTGQIGNSAYFDGNNDYVELPHASSLLLDDGTISFWFKSDDTNGDQGLFSKDSSGYDNGGHVHIYLDSSTLRVRFQSASASYTLQSSDGMGSLSSGVWYHVALCFGSKGLKLYVNGTLVSEDSYTGGLGTTSGGSGNTEPFVFGADTMWSGNGTVNSLYNHFEGWIDDVRIFNAGMDATQVGRVMLGNSPGVSKGASVVDTSGSGLALDLTIADTSAVTWVGGGGLTLDSATSISSGSAATKIATAIGLSKGVAIVVDYTPGVVDANARRLVNYGSDSTNRNFSLSVAQDSFTGSVDTAGGMDSVLASLGQSIGQKDQLILSYDGANGKVYYNGTNVGSKASAGDLSGWNSAFPLVLGNSGDDTLPWLGTLHRVAIYNKAFTDNQATAVYGGNEPQEENESFNVRWVEGP